MGQVLTLEQHAAELQLSGRMSSTPTAEEIMMRYREIRQQLEAELSVVKPELQQTKEELVNAKCELQHIKEELEEERRSRQEREQLDYEGARLRRQHRHISLAGVLLFTGLFIFLSFSRESGGFTYHYAHSFGALLIATAIYLLIAYGMLPGLRAVYRTFEKLLTHFGLGFQQHGIAMVRTAVDLRDIGNIMPGGVTGTVTVEPNAVNATVQPGAVRGTADARAQVGPKCVIS
jgi:hypothetical protein